jgi:hypothetical protein
VRDGRKFRARNRPGSASGKRFEPRNITSPSGRRSSRETTGQVTLPVGAPDHQSPSACLHGRRQPDPARHSAPVARPSPAPSADTLRASTGPLNPHPPTRPELDLDRAARLRHCETMGDTSAGSGAIATGLNAGICTHSQSCWQHRNNWLMWHPSRARATSEAWRQAPALPRRRTPSRFRRSSTAGPEPAFSNVKGCAQAFAHAGPVVAGRGSPDRDDGKR